MDNRVELHEMLVSLLGSGNVYFQPPETVMMHYPCIVYARDTVNTIFANNDPYKMHTRYKITIIDKNPDSLIPGKVARLRTSIFATHFTSDNLNHDVYSLYF